MRPDIFIIWGHGIKHLNEIMSMLRTSFQIIMIKHHTITDLPKFIDDIYACDSYPLEHLKAKTRYLLNTPKECYLVLVVNQHVDEQLVGVDPYRKPQCLYLQQKKHGIRDKFNPRSEKGNKTENHVIHGTDYVNQVDHILKVFGLQPKETYFRKIDFPTYYPWHLPLPKTWRLTAQTPSNLKANILGRGYVPITDTPHYLYVKGRRKSYVEYFNKHMGKALMEDHFPEAFDNLIEQGEYYPIITQGDRVLDGVHRLAIFAACCMDNKIECIDVDF